MLHTVLLIINFFCAAGIVALVLLQRGKGAEAGAGFGSGASGTVFGARGATTALSRTTAILAGVFMLTSLSLSYMSSHATSTSSANSLLDRLSQPTAPVHGAPAGALPGAPASVPVAPAATGAPGTTGPAGAANGSVGGTAAPASAPAAPKH